jgi:mono/diheme cytochrome c family protein
MKDFIFGFLATVVLILIVPLTYLRLGAAEVRGDVRAPWWESRLMQFALHASVSRSAQRIQNPLPHSDEQLIAGGKMYLDGCAGCHGTPGRPARNRIAYVPSPEFAHVGTQYSEPELFWVVKHGIRRTGMSAYGSFYSDQQVWQLVEFVQQMNHLPPAVFDAIQPKRP